MTSERDLCRRLRLGIARKVLPSDYVVGKTTFGGVIREPEYADRVLQAAFGGMPAEDYKPDPSLVRELRGE